MKELTSPITLIKKAISIFFEKRNMIYFFKIFSIPFVLGIISYSFSYVISSQGYTQDQFVEEITKGNPIIIWYFVVWSIAAFVIGLWAQVAAYESVIRVIKNGSLDFKDTYLSVRNKIGKFLILNLLVGLIIAGGFLLLIIPGIIFTVWYGFSMWTLFDKNLGISDSLKRSKQIVQGIFWKVLGRMVVLGIFMILAQMIFVFIPGGYGSIAATIFGGLFLLPYYLLYQELSANSN